MKNDSSKDLEAAVMVNTSKTNHMSEWSKMSPIKRSLATLSIGAFITGLIGVASTIFYGLKNKKEAESAPDIIEYMRKLYATKSGFSLSSAEGIAVDIICKNHKIPQALTDLIKDKNQRGISALLEEINSNQAASIILETAVKLKLKFSEEAKRKLLPYFSKDMNILKEAHKQALDSEATEIAQMIESSISTIQKHINLLGIENLSHNQQIQSDMLEKEPMSNELPLNSHSSPPLLPAQTDNNALTSYTDNSITNTPTTISSLDNANFTINSILTAAMVLKLCGMDKFTKFTLAPAPVQAKPDHKLPENSWNPTEFEKLLHSDPKAQVLANSVTEYIKLEHLNDQRQWTQEEVIKFVNSPKFKEAQQQAAEMEKSMRRATEADFGIESTANSKNLPTKNNELHKRFI